jgi:hypothetical protein
MLPVTQLGKKYRFGHMLLITYDSDLLGWVSFVNAFPYHPSGQWAENQSSHVM